MNLGERVMIKRITAGEAEKRKCTASFAHWHGVKAGCSLPGLSKVRASSALTKSLRKNPDFNGLVCLWQEYQAGNGVEALNKQRLFKTRV